ncbi:MAG: hypothetical protein AAGE65_12335 [Planctomycetota bacterium]
MDTGLWSADWAESVGASPAVWTGVLLGAMALGLVLWLLGGRLAKAGTVLAGLVVGGLAVTSLSIGLASASGVGAWVLALGVGGAIAGALLAGLLFRLWMGVTAAGLLALAVPAAVLIWMPPGLERDEAEGAADATAAVQPLAFGEGEDGGTLVDSLKETWNEGLAEALDAEQVQAALAETGQGGEVAEVVPESLVDAERVQAIAFGQARRVWDVLKAAWDREMARLGAWWDGLATGTRTTVIGGSAVGAVLGLLLGLIAPNFMAKLQTAMVGALLLFFPAGVLVHAYLVGPVEEALEGTDTAAATTGVAGLASYWPTQPRAMLLAVGLITAIGLLLQWTLFRKKTDS